jgi:hypothetical protein
VDMVNARYLNYWLARNNCNAFASTAAKGAGLSSDGSVPAGAFGWGQDISGVGK